MKITTPQQLSSVLKDIRTASKLSQHDVAKKIGIRQDTVSNFENNPESTKLDTLFRLLSAMDLELEVQSRNPQNPAKQADNWQEEW